jgi:hypothetical protein
LILASLWCKQMFSNEPLREWLLHTVSE